MDLFDCSPTFLIFVCVRSVDTYSSSLAWPGKLMKKYEKIRRPLGAHGCADARCQSCLLAILYHSGVSDLVFLHIVEF